MIETETPKTFTYRDERGNPAKIRLWQNINSLEVDDGITGPNFQRFAGNYKFQFFHMPGKEDIDQQQILVKHQFVIARPDKPNATKPNPIFYIWIRTR